MYLRKIVRLQKKKGKFGTMYFICDNILFELNWVWVNCSFRFLYDFFLNLFAHSKQYCCIITDRPMTFMQILMILVLRYLIQQDFNLLNMHTWTTQQIGKYNRIQIQVRISLFSVFYYSSFFFNISMCYLFLHSPPFKYAAGERQWPENIQFAVHLMIFFYS